MKYWMLAPAPLDASPPLSQLPAVRRDFLQCLEGAFSESAERLTLRIERARSLRELWHLRAALFGVLALELNQSEAQKRVQGLSHYFDSTGQKPAFTPSPEWAE